MSDAFHLLSDVASFFVALIAIYLAERPPTKRELRAYVCVCVISFFLFYAHVVSRLLLLIIGHTYGFHRAEVIAAVISVITIWVLTAFLVHEAIQRVLYPQEINAPLVRYRKMFRTLCFIYSTLFLCCLPI